MLAALPGKAYDVANFIFWSNENVRTRLVQNC